LKVSPLLIGRKVTPPGSDDIGSFFSIADACIGGRVDLSISSPWRLASSCAVRTAGSPSMPKPRP